MLRRYFGFILIVAMTIGGGVAEGIRDGIWSRFQRYASPYLGPLPAGPPPAALASRVVVVVVRDLRSDIARGLPALAALRERGADVTLVHRAPVYATPAWMTLLSGAPAEIHGFTTNDAWGKTTPDNWLRASQSVGRPNLVAAGERWERVLGNDIGFLAPAVGGTPALADADAVASALEALNARLGAPQIVVVELQSLTARDDLRAGERLDSAIRTLAQAAGVLPDPADPQVTTAFLVVADRGAQPDGGDGGDEEAIAHIPLVMAGAGIRPQTRLTAPATSFAPTVAALAGLRIPAHSEGPLLAAALVRPPLLASAAQLATFYEAWSETARVPRFAAELYRGAQAGLAAGSLATYQALTISMQAAADAAREARLSAERLQRLPVAVGLLLLLLGAGALCVSAGGWRAVVGAAITLGGAYALFTFGREHALTFTVMPAGASAAFYDETARDAAVVFAVAGLIMAATTGGLDDVLQAVTAVISGIGLALIALTALPLAYYAQHGVELTWALPEQGVFMGALTALTGLAAIDVRILPGNLPVPISAVIAAGTAVVYLLIRRRR